MNYFFDTFRTPCGEFSLAVNQSGAVVATAFGHETELKSRIRLCHPLRDKHENRLCHVMSDKHACAAAREQVLGYFAGERREFDLALAPAGTEFQQRVWRALQRIPFGETRSYGHLAREVRSSPRAVGRANATNPICLIVPCHRVIGADGSLTGFAFGEAIKHQLLQHERSSGRTVCAA